MIRCDICAWDLPASVEAAIVVQPGDVNQNMGCPEARPEATIIPLALGKPTRTSLARIWPVRNGGTGNLTVPLIIHDTFIVLELLLTPVTIGHSSKERFMAGSAASGKRDSYAEDE